jgi:thiol-disulfide isomerase/thioredoxin
MVCKFHEQYTTGAYIFAPAKSVEMLVFFFAWPTYGIRLFTCFGGREWRRYCPYCRMLVIILHFLQEQILYFIFRSFVTNIFSFCTVNSQYQLEPRKSVTGRINLAH